MRPRENPALMLGMTHIVLRLGLCSAVLNRPPQTPLAIHVNLVDRKRRYPTEQTIVVQRGYESSVTVPFDAQAGIYAMHVSIPQDRCNAADYVDFLTGKSRAINEQLSDGPAPMTQPMLLEGDVPQSFLYLQPTYVFFDKSTECNKPVGDPIPVHEVIENDQDSFYVWLYADQQTYARAPLVVAMQLQTATGEEHYIRLKIPFPSPWQGFPIDYRFSITEDTADAMATQPTGVLLCPKIYMTSGG